MKFAVLVFDLDETLIVEEASVQRAFVETCALARERHGLDPEALCRISRQICTEMWASNPSREYCLAMGISSTEAMWGEFTGTDEHLVLLQHWAGGYRLGAWREALRRCGVDDAQLANELAVAYPGVRQKYHVAYEDARPALERLRGTFKLGMITNGAPDVQRSKIVGSGLEGLFDVVVVSGEVGVGKPERQVFEIALSRLGVSGGDALMVGDNLRRDIDGARRAGLQTAWVNRHGRALEGGVVPDLEVANMLELERILLIAGKG